MTRIDAGHAGAGIELFALQRLYSSHQRTDEMGPIATELLDSIRRYRLDQRAADRVAIIQRKIQRGQLTEAKAKSYLKALDRLIQDQIDFPNMLHRAPTREQLHKKGSPEIKFGSLIEAPDIPYGLRLSDGPQHLWVQGRAGAGKTVLLRLSVSGIDEWSKKTGRTISIIVFDFKGGDFSDLPTILGDNWLHFHVANGMRMGCNGPDSVPDADWLDFVSTVFAARFHLQYAKTTINRTLSWAFRVLNQDGQKPKIYPNPDLLLEILRTSPQTMFSGKAAYSQSAAHELEEFRQVSGPIFASLGGFDPIRDVIEPGKSCVIQVPTRNHALRNTITELVMGQVLLDRLVRDYKTSHVDVCFVIDESDPLVSHQASEVDWPDQMPIVSLTARLGREVGIMLALGAGRISGVSKTILADMHNFVLLAQNSEGCIRDAAGTLLLPRGAEILLPSLGKGQCVFRFGESGWPHAVLGQIDPFPSRRKEVTRPFDTHPYVPAKPLSQLPILQDALFGQIAHHKSKQPKAKTTSAPEISANAQKLLELASQNLLLPIAQLWEEFTKAPTPAGRMSAINALMAREFLDVIKTRIGKRRAHIPKILTAGWKHLKMEERKLPGRGERKHRLYQNWYVERWKRRGCEARVEWKVPGTNFNADAGHLMDGKLHVTEVCDTAIDNIVDHLRACLIDSNAVEAVTIATAKNEISQKARELIAAASDLAPVMNRVRFESVEVVMKELFP